jgi:hypothetical protein
VWVPDKAVAWARGTVHKVHRDGRSFDVLLDADMSEPDGTAPAAKGSVTVSMDMPAYAGMEGLPLQNKAS